MKITDIHSERRGFFLTSVRFEAEASDGRGGERQAEAMNRFYMALEETADRYAEACAAECALSRYVCRICAVWEGEDICVTVSLSHKLPGEMSRRKGCLHRWRGGLLQEEKMI